MFLTLPKAFQHEDEGHGPTCAQQKTGVRRRQSHIPWKWRMRCPLGAHCRAATTSSSQNILLKSHHFGVRLFFSLKKRCEIPGAISERVASSRLPTPLQNPQTKTLTSSHLLGTAKSLPVWLWCELTLSAQKFIFQNKCACKTVFI